jgi:hypothetical protein
MFTGYAWRLWRTLLRRAGATTFRFSIVHLHCCSRRCCSTTTCGPALNLRRRRSRSPPCRRCPAGCDQLPSLGAKPTFRSTDITGATFARTSSCPMSTAARAPWPISPAR